MFYLAWTFEAHAATVTGPFSRARLVAPPFAALARAHDKARFARDAKTFGMAPPETVVVTNRSELVSLYGDAAGWSSSRCGRGLQVGC